MSVPVVRTRRRSARACDEDRERSRRTELADGAALCGCLFVAWAVVSAVAVFGSDTVDGAVGAWVGFLLRSAAVVVPAAAVAAPLLMWVRRRRGVAVTLLVATVIGPLPAIGVAVAGSISGSPFVLFTPVSGLLGEATALCGAALWLAVARRLRPTP